MTPRQALRATVKPKVWVANYGHDVLDRGGPEADELRKKLLGIAEAIHEKLAEAVEAAEENDWGAALAVAYAASSDEYRSGGADPMSAPVRKAIIRGAARWLSGPYGPELPYALETGYPTLLDIAEAVGGCLGIVPGRDPHPGKVVAGGRCEACLRELADKAEKDGRDYGIWAIARKYFQERRSS